MVPRTRKQGIKKFKSFQQIIRCRGCTLDSYMNTVIQLGFWTAILVLSLELYVMVLQLKVSRLLKLTRLILVDLLVKITLQMLMLNFCWVSVGLANFCLLCLIVVTPTWNCHSTFGSLKERLVIELNLFCNFCRSRSLSRSPLPSVS